MVPVSGLCGSFCQSLLEPPVRGHPCEPQCSNNVVSLVSFLWKVVCRWNPSVVASNTIASPRNAPTPVRGGNGTQERNSPSAWATLRGSLSAKDGLRSALFAENVSFGMFSVFPCNVFDTRGCPTVACMSFVSVSLCMCVSKVVAKRLAQPSSVGNLTLCDFDNMDCQSIPSSCGTLARSGTTSNDKHTWKVAIHVRKAARLNYDRTP